MDADYILSIEKCGDLFPNNSEAAKQKYKELIKEWHPDISGNPKSSDVFSKLTQLYRQAQELIKAGKWEKTNCIIMSRKDGKRIELNYETCFDFELGKCYVSQSKIVYIMGGDKKKYYDNALMRIRSLKYQDKDMEDKLKKFIPELYDTFKTADSEYVIVLNKEKGVYPLRDVLGYFKGRLNDRHVAWIVSRLCNLTCFLEFNGLVHNGINIDNCFISPSQHAVYLLGGWWYTVRSGERMTGTTKDIYDVMPVASKTSKCAAFGTDLEAVKLLARELLGEKNCRKLAFDALIPKEFLNFITGGSGKSAYEEFTKWDKALNASYGVRKFTEMNVDGIYGIKK